MFILIFLSSQWLIWPVGSYLSNFDMMISCVWLAEVLAEKLMQFGIYLVKKLQKIKMDLKFVSVKIYFTDILSIHVQFHLKK